MIRKPIFTLAAGVVLLLSGVFTDAARSQVGETPPSDDQLLNDRLINDRLWIWSVEGGVDAKVVDSDLRASAVFRRNGGGLSDALADLGDTIFGAGGDIRAYRRLGTASIFVGGWSMGGDVDERFSTQYAPGDSLSLDVNLSPNSVTFYSGVEIGTIEANFLSNGTVEAAVGVYGGIRLQELEFTHRAEGPAGQFAEVRGEETLTSPVIGIEATARIRPRTGNLYTFVRGGFQVDFGDEYISTVQTPGATSTVEIDSGTTTSGYIMGGVGLRFQWQPAL